MVNDYWKKRIEAEQLAKMERSATISDEIGRLYDYHFKELEKEIRAFEQRYADKNGLSLSEVKARVDEMDVRAFEEKAKKYVAEKDFSAKANSELELYNLKMKINRLELLQYQLDLEMVALGDAEHKLTERFLNDEYVKALESQAGLLGQSVQTAGQIGNVAQTVLNTSFKGATWSNRIWQRQDALREIVARMTEDYLLKGKNPTTMIGKIRKEFGASANEAKRLAVTEGARVATEAQRQSLIANGYDEYEYIAEPKACGICKPLNGKIFKVKDMEPGENAAPMHPYCHCSVAAHFSMSDAEYERLISESAESVLDKMGRKGYSFDFIDFSDPKNISKETIKEIFKRAGKAVEDFKKTTGTDLIVEYKKGNLKNTSNPYDDNKSKFMKFLLEKTGYNAIPVEISETKEYNLLYRGVTPNKKLNISAMDFYNRYKTGDMDISGATSSLYGRGIYASQRKRTAQIYAKDGKDNDSGLVFGIYLPKDAKVGKTRDVAKILQLSHSIENWGELDDIFQLLSKKQRGGRDGLHDLWSIFAGYDALEDTSGDITVIFNRGKTGVGKV